MDIMFYVNLIMSLIPLIALVYGIDVIMSVKGELDDLREE